MDPAPPSDGENASARDLLRRLSRDDGTSRYKIEGEVARGGMGAILRVWDAELRRHLAMKVILGRGDASSGESPQVHAMQLARFLEEAQVTGQLDHPGIVPVHELGLDSDGRVYFTMKLVKGRDLKQIFELAFEHKEGWSETRALGVILKVCEAMAYAHAKGVIHRDLKPANVMVGSFGEVFVMDWGLARVLGSKDRHDIRIAPEFTASLGSVKTERRDERDDLSDSPIVTMDGDVVGTPAYMPLEQAQGQIEKLTPRSDVYAIGAMIYHLLARHPPYAKRGVRVSNRTLLAMALHGPPTGLSTLRSDVPAELVAICEKAMAREASERYADTLGLAEDLRAYLEHRVVAAYETGTWAETKKWLQRNKSLAASLAAVVLLLVAGLTTSLVFKSRADERAADLALANDTIRQREAAAQSARAEADARALEARATLYVAAITGAQSSRRLKEPGNVRRLLESAPEELRNWEWRYLAAATDTSLLVLPGGKSASFSPDGSRIVTLSREGAACIFDASTGAELARLEGGSVTSASFSPDGSRVLTASAEGTARLCDARSGRELTRLAGHSGALDLARFTADGSRIVTASAEDRTIRTWDATSGRELAQLALDGPNRSDVAIDRDGSRMLFQSADKVGRVRDLVTGEEMAQLGSGLFCMEFSPDGSNVVIASIDNTVRVVTAAGGREVLRLQGLAELVMFASFSPDGSTILTSGFDDTALTVRLWDAGSGKELARLEQLTLPVRSAAFAPDRSLVALTPALDCSPRLWNPENKTELPRLEGHVASVIGASFDRDGSRLITWSNDDTTRVWDRPHETELGQLRAHSSAVKAAEFSPDGTRILTASIDGALLLWDATNASVLAHLDGLPREVDLARFTVDGSRIVASDYRGTACAWDAVTGRTLGKLTPSTRLTTSWFSPDGSRIATVSSEGSTHVFDATSGRVIARSQDETEGVATSDGEARIEDELLGGSARAVFSPDGSSVVTVTKRGRVRALDAASCRKIAEFEGHTGAVKSVEFSPDGSRIVTASEDGTARVFDASSGAELACVRPNSTGLMGASFSPDGQRIVTVGSEATANIWDAASGAELARLEGHVGIVFAASFSPDGSRVLTLGGDGNARVWDSTTGQLLARLEGHTGSVRSVRFSPDGSRIVTASEDHNARVWDSVPHRVREAELRSRAAARLEAERVVGELITGSAGFGEAGSRLHADTSIDRSVKLEALNVLTERAERAHRRSDELRSKSQERRWLSRLAGDEAWPDERDVAAQLDADPSLPKSADELNRMAWELVDPDRPCSGEEIRAVLLARRAMAAARATAKPLIRDTLAQALYRAGRFDEALAEERRAVAEVDVFQKPRFEEILSRLESQIARLSDASGRLRHASIVEQMRDLDRDIALLAQDVDTRRWRDEDRH